MPDEAPDGAACAAGKPRLAYHLQPSLASYCATGAEVSINLNQSVEGAGKMQLWRPQVVFSAVFSQGQETGLVKQFRIKKYS